jgi:hypothetical protein
LYLKDHNENEQDHLLPRIKVLWLLFCPLYQNKITNEFIKTNSNKLTTLVLKIFNRNAINVTKRNLLGTIINICFNVLGTVITLCSLKSSEISIWRAFLFILTKSIKAIENIKIRKIYFKVLKKTCGGCCG